MEDKYNTFWRRFFAGLLDAIVFIPIGFLESWIKSFPNEVFLIFGLFFVYLSYYVYSIVFHWQTGQTLGKKWMGVMVVNVSEDRLLSLNQAFKRDSIILFFDLLGLIFLSTEIIRLGEYPSGDYFAENLLSSLMVIWFLLEFITMLTNNKRRAIHDLLAGSVCIRAEYWQVPSLK
jgi:uncharacterized RDD family membrane protein YckC